MNNKNEIIETAKLMPAMKIDEVVGAFDEYQKLREKLERDGDFVEFVTSAGKKKAPTKQWRVKLERFFGLSVEISKEWESKEENGTMTYHKRSRVTHNKSGLFHEATGACNTNEKIRTLGQISYQIKSKHKDWSNDFIQARAKDTLRDEISKAPHNAESHAETRAKNRAILEFVGFGEVSAEELSTTSETGKTEKRGNDKNPATKKQVDFIREKMINSSKSTTDEKKEWNKLLINGITFEEADKKISWWLGNSKKGVKGERDKREKEKAKKEGKANNKKLLEEIFRLRRENFLENDKDFYKALSLNKKLEEHTEKELRGIIGKLKGYVPEFEGSDAGPDEDVSF